MNIDRHILINIYIYISEYIYISRVNPYIYIYVSVLQDRSLSSVSATERDRQIGGKVAT